MFASFCEAALGALACPDSFYPTEGECHDQLKALLQRRFIDSPASDSLLLVAPCEAAGRQLLKQLCPPNVQRVILDGRLLVDAASALAFLGNALFGCRFANYESLECHWLQQGSLEPCIVILDGFEGFCRHPQQELLAMLFELTRQSKIKAPLVVIGLTANSQADQLLEKRVRSRFSQTRLFMATDGEWNLSKTLETALLQPGRNKAATAWNQGVRAMLGEMGPWIDAILDMSLDHVATVVALIYRQVAQAHTPADLTRNLRERLWEQTQATSLNGLSDTAITVLLMLRHASLQDAANATLNCPEAIIRAYSDYARLYSLEQMQLVKPCSRVRLRLAIEELQAHGLLEVNTAAREPAELIWQPCRATLNLLGLEPPEHLRKLL